MKYFKVKTATDKNILFLPAKSTKSKTVKVDGDKIRVIVNKRNVFSNQYVTRIDYRPVKTIEGVIIGKVKAYGRLAMIKPNRSDYKVIRQK